MKFNNGDKVVIEIKGVLPNDNGDPVYFAGDGYFGEVIPLEKSAESLLTYTEPLNDKIKRQEAEIIRLLKENAELKRDLKYYHTGTDTCDIESARVAGQQEAWELARKIAYDGYRNNELKEIFGSVCLDDIFNLTYTEAAEKVAEWEQKKEEICVGDVFLSNRIGTKCIVTHINNETVTTLWGDGSYGDRSKNYIREGFEKIGHIDIASMLVQIGESNA